jgi:hypothetical protein
MGICLTHQTATHCVGRLLKSAASVTTYWSLVSEADTHLGEFRAREFFSHDLFSTTNQRFILDQLPAGRRSPGSTISLGFICSLKSFLFAAPVF